MTAALQGVHVHPNGLCESTEVGAGTRIWAFAHVLPKARIGRDCNICDHVFIENDVVIGDRVTIKSGVQLWDGVRLADGVFVGPNVSFTNDPFPRSKAYLDRPAITNVDSGASIGANATVLPGVTIGCNAMVGAGSVVMRDVPPRAVLVGNPGRVVDFAGTRPAIKSLATAALTGEDAIGVGESRLVRVTQSIDVRGSLGALDHVKDLPFVPARTFFVANVPEWSVRGMHAHRDCHQVFVVAAGGLTALVDDGRESRSVRLDAASHGLYVPPGTWGSQARWGPGTVLLVFASHSWQASDYIHDYQAFLGFKNMLPR